MDLSLLLDGFVFRVCLLLSFAFNPEGHALGAAILRKEIHTNPPKGAIIYFKRLRHDIRNMAS